MVLKAGETFNYFDKTYTYVGESNNPDYIEVKDSNGKSMSIPKDALMKTSLWSFEPDPEVLAEYDSKAEGYRNEKLKAREEQKTLRQTLMSYMDSWGLSFKHQLNSEQREVYCSLENDLYGARMDATAAGNREQSTLLDKFLYLT